jgi:hypothetical protein
MAAGAVRRMKNPAGGEPVGPLFLLGCCAQNGIRSRMIDWAIRQNRARRPLVASLHQVFYPVDKPEAAKPDANHDTVRPEPLPVRIVRTPAKETDNAQAFVDSRRR